MKKKWRIEFEENGSEYTGVLHVESDALQLDENNEKVFFADGVRVEIDERIIEAVEIIESGLTRRAADLPKAGEKSEADEMIDRGVCPSCTWRGDVSLENGVCPQCDTNWLALRKSASR